MKKIHNIKMEFISKDVIKISRELSDLDKFAFEFIDILCKHTDYAIISGYVSILLGRSRGSEDIDILIPKIDSQKLGSLIRDLKKSQFYCLNTDDDKGIHSYMNDNLSVRFAEDNKVIPNIELKFAKNDIENHALTSSITLKISNKEIKISNLELQIAFKEKVLKSPKDIEDARHIRGVAEGRLDESMIKTYEKMLHGI